MNKTDTYLCVYACEYPGVGRGTLINSPGGIGKNGVPFIKFQVVKYRFFFSAAK